MPRRGQLDEIFLNVNEFESNLGEARHLFRIELIDFFKSTHVLDPRSCFRGNIELVER